MVTNIHLKLKSGEINCHEKNTELKHAFNRTKHNEKGAIKIMIPSGHFHHISHYLHCMLHILHY